MAKKKKTVKKKKVKEEVEELEKEETTATEEPDEIKEEVKLTREQIIVQACQHYGVARNDVANVSDVDGGIVLELKPPNAKKLRYIID